VKTLHCAAKTPRHHCSVLYSS